MKKFFIFDIIVGLLLLSAAFGIGLKISKNYNEEQLINLQNKLDFCETGWKIDMDLFFPGLIESICEKEFEKMSC